MRMFEFTISIIGFFMVMLFLMFGSNQTGFEKGLTTMRNEAIRVGVAHYGSDNNGVATFVWNVKTTNEIAK